MRRPNAWLMTYVERPTAAVRIVTVPFAGGSAAAFRGLVDLWPDFEMTSVEYPGRGMRFSEPAARRVADLAEPLAAALGDLDARPFVLVGYSLGALVAFEVARALRRRGARLPVGLVTAVRSKPDREEVRTDVHAMPTHQFKQVLASYGGTPRELLDNDELFEMLLPTLRADFEAAGSYRFVTEPPLDLPLTVIAGSQDPGTREEDCAGWRAQTTGPFSLHVLDAGHFLLHTHRAAFAAVVAEAARNAVAP